MANTTMQQVGKRIRAARIEQRLTRQQLGDRIVPPVTQQTVRYWEAGEKMPTLINYLQLQKILSLPEAPEPALEEQKQ